MTVDTALRDALSVAFRLIDTPVWEPYPWQVCPTPVPTQGAFLIEGGRGIGKTDGCAHYVLEHVNGPPCDRRIRGGHRIAIVAPTLDDAAESCVNGPSGLRAYQPAVQLKTALGGSKVLFPGGAEGKLFSGATEGRGPAPGRREPLLGVGGGGCRDPVAARRLIAGPLRFAVGS